MKVDLNLPGKRGTPILDTGNQLLIIVIAVLVGYVAINFSSLQRSILEPISTQVMIEEEIPAANIATMQIKSFEVYEKGIKARNLFATLQSDLKPDTRILQKALPALHKRIKLIGILIDSDSKAIVEDLKEKQTQFLSKGESLGSAVLEDIREDKVLFKYANEIIEMTP